jgi:hypothetical protein
MARLDYSPLTEKGGAFKESEEDYEEWNKVYSRSSLNSTS